MSAELKLSILTLMIAAFTIGTDFTGALLLVPRIENSFGADITTTQWVLNIYALVFAMGMVAGGRLGDMYGRRNLLLIGLAIFITASVACLFSPSISWLIAARALQGVGAAIMWPCILAFGATIGPSDDRAFVMGLVLAGVTGGNVIGPLISGIVVSLGDWRLFYLVNAVLACAAAVLVSRILPKERLEKADERVDIAGIATLSLATLALLYALDVGADWGWASTPILALFALSLFLFVIFPFVEKRVSDPTVPSALMHNREFILALWTNALLVPAIFIAFLYFPQYLQKVLGWSVLEASVGMMPLMVLLSIGSIISGRYYKTYGPKRLLLTGYTLVTLGAVSILLISADWGYLGVLPAMLLIGLGAAIAVGSAGTATVSAVSPKRAGLAGGLSFMLHLTFGAIGVAVATAIMYASNLRSLQSGLAQAGVKLSDSDQTVLSGGSIHTDAARSVLTQLGGADAEKVRVILSEAFTHGMSHAYWPAAVCAAIGIAVVLAIDEEKLQTVADQ